MTGEPTLPGCNPNTTGCRALGEFKSTVTEKLNHIGEQEAEVKANMTEVKQEVIHVAEALRVETKADFGRVHQRLDGIQKDQRAALITIITGVVIALLNYLLTHLK